MSDKYFLIESSGDFENAPRWVALENSTLSEKDPMWVGVKHSPGITSLFESLWYDRILDGKGKAKVRTIKRIGIVVQFDD